MNIVVTFPREEDKVVLEHDFYSENFVIRREFIVGTRGEFLHFPAKVGLFALMSLSEQPGEVMDFEELNQWPSEGWGPGINLFVKETWPLKNVLRRAIFHLFVEEELIVQNFEI